MNFARRLGFVVGRFLGTKCFLQAESVVCLGRSSDIPYRSNDVSVKICRNFTSDYKSKPEQELLNDIEEDEVLTFKEFLSQNLREEEYADVIMKVLDCNEAELRKILQENIFWKNFPINMVVERIEAYKELGVKGTDLVQQSSLLYTDFEYNYELLSLLCTKLGCNGHDLFPMLLLPKETIDRYLEKSSEDLVELGNYVNRIRYFSTKLKFPVRNFTETLVDHQFLLRLPIRNIMKTMNALLDGGVAREYIFNDLHVFRYKAQKIRARMEFCQKAGIRNVKPWLLRETPDKFLRATNLKQTRQSVGGGLSWTEFVAQSLNLSVEEVKALIKYDKRCENVSLLKTKKIVDILLSEGFAREHILQSPQAFITSIPRLKRRILILRKSGIDPVQHWEFLRRMCYSDKDFMGILQGYCGYSADTSDTTSVHDAS